ncbi:MAG: porin family protein [Roseivirga sp.]
MKKVTITLLCFMMATHFVQAKVFSIGPRAGVSLSQLAVDEAAKTQSRLTFKDHWGYHVGGFARLTVSVFYLQPEILITGSGAKFSRAGEDKELKLSFTKLDIPVLPGISFLGMRAQIGPVFSLLFSATEGGKDVKEHYQYVTVGWQGGLGVDIWNMVIDLKYEGNLTKFGEKIAGVYTHHRNHQWILSMGVDLF